MFGAIPRAITTPFASSRSVLMIRTSLRAGRSFRPTQAWIPQVTHIHHLQPSSSMMQTASCSEPDALRVLGQDSSSDRLRGLACDIRAPNPSLRQLKLMLLRDSLRGDPHAGKQLQIYSFRSGDSAQSHEVLLKLAEKSGYSAEVYNKLEEFFRPRLPRRCRLGFHRGEASR